MTSAPPESPPEPTGRVTFERLRERTDELELLISGLSMVALFTLPGWLLETFESQQSLLPLAWLSAAFMALPMTVLFCYLLASCFALHLGLRAYWVGLIGLKSAFPQGIRWERASGTGPISREWLQRALPSIDGAIEGADRIASMLFSVITLSGLVLLWLGLLATLTFAGAGLVGHQFGGTNATISIAMTVFGNLLIGSVLLLWLADSVLARYFPVLRGWRWYRASVRALGWVVGLYFPPRLTAPVRLTLQTNTRPMLFLGVFIAMIVFLPWLAVRQFQMAMGFDRYGTHAQLHARDLDDGHVSAHYESQLVARNRARGRPVIPAPVIEQNWLPLFLPYAPIRDDQIVAQRCPQRRPFENEVVPGVRPQVPDEAAAARSRGTAECLARLWEVRLNGAEVTLTDFVPAERADLGFRGLTGFIDLRAATPGPQKLEVIWRPRPEQDKLPVDDLISGRLRYAIPFLWDPQAR